MDAISDMNSTNAYIDMNICVVGAPVPRMDIDPRIVENDTSLMPAPEFADWEVALKVTFYIVSFSMTVCGNVLVILTVALNKSMRTTVNSLIVNLAISDLLIGLFCTWIHMGSHIAPEWPFGAVLCKMKQFIQVIVVTSSTLTLTVISADRFVAIVLPLRGRLSAVHIGLIVGLTWLLSIGVALPQLIVMEQKELYWENRHEIWCEESWPKVYVNEQCETSQPGRKIYYTIYVIVVYFLSVAVMIIAYTLIMVTILTRKQPGAATMSSIAVQDKTKRKVARMLMAVVLTFIVCWTPQQSLLLWEVYRTPGEYPEYVDGLKYAAVYIAYFNSAINPIIYGGLNEHFRKGFVQIFKCSKLRNRNRVAPETIPEHVEYPVESNHIPVYENMKICRRSACGEYTNTVC